VFSPAREPSRVQGTEISDVVAEENSSGIAGTDKVLFVAVVYHAALERRHRINAPRAKSDEERFMHGVFVEIQPNPAHERA